MADAVAETVGAVIHREPDWSRLPAETPPLLRRLVRRCLEKDPRRRIAHAADVRLEIEDAGQSLPVHANEAVGPRKTSWLRVAIAIIVAALAVAAVFAWRGVDGRRAPPVYASIDAPPDHVLGEDDFLVSLPTRTPIVFTPDGRSLIIQAAREGRPQLFLRRLDRPEARPIPGTDNARVPFVSPDGRWIGFWASNELRKVPIDGGTPTAVAQLATAGGLGPLGAAWGPHDVIVFGDPASGRIMRVPAGGGIPEAVTDAPENRRFHVAPFFLPDGDRFLFSVVGGPDPADSRVMVQALDGGETRVVVTSAADARLLPSGHLVFMRLGTLMVVRFDVEQAEIIGNPEAVLADVMQSGRRVRAGGTTFHGMFAISSLGALAAIRGQLVGGEENRLVWITRGGRSTSAEPATGAPVGNRLYTRIAPDQSRALVTLDTGRRSELWLVDWTRGLWAPCGDCQGDLSLPGIWAPDGRRLLLPQVGSLVENVLDGAGADRVVVREAGRRLVPFAWLADERIVYTSSVRGQGDSEIKLLDAPGGTARVIVPLDRVGEPAVSPDGRWLAYTSNKTTPPTVIVQALMGSGFKTVVSTGREPVWSKDGRTLYFLRAPGPAAFAVGITVAGNTLVVGSPHELFRQQNAAVCNARCYDVGEGGRFLMRESVKLPSVRRMDLVLNWTSTLPANR
jgi:serine/threonine-protein kinase